MKAQVLKQLPYSRDGIKVETLAAGTIHEILDDLAAGLVREKYIVAVAGGIAGKGPLPGKEPDKAPAEKSPGEKEPEKGDGKEPVKAEGAPVPGAGAGAGDAGNDAGRATREPGAAAVEIPADWAKLEWNDRKALAAKLSTTKIVAKEDVAAAVEQELAWRAEDASAAAGAAGGAA